MVVKELEDVLLLVKDMPEIWQKKCAHDLSDYVKRWQRGETAPDRSPNSYFGSPQSWAARAIGKGER